MIMKKLCVAKNINKIAMPLIGCGLDRLQWEKVSEIVQEVFKDIDIEIVVCGLKTDSGPGCIISRLEDVYDQRKK